MEWKGVEWIGAELQGRDKLAGRAHRASYGSCAEPRKYCMPWELRSKTVSKVTKVPGHMHPTYLPNLLPTYLASSKAKQRAELSLAQLQRRYNVPSSPKFLGFLGFLCFLCLLGFQASLRFGSTGQERSRSRSRPPRSPSFPLPPFPSSSSSSSSSSTIPTRRRRLPSFPSLEFPLV